MSQLWKCPNGHTFKGPGSDDTVGGDEATQCPLCGSDSQVLDEAHLPDADDSIEEALVLDDEESLPDAASLEDAPVEATTAAP